MSAVRTAIGKVPLEAFACTGLEILRQSDPALYRMLAREYERQSRVLAMVAASSVADPSVLACEAMTTTNVTTEGYPGARYHAGCEFVDEIEDIAIERAKAAFRAKYANVQPHSGTSANAIVMFSLLRAGETILGMELDSGGHLTHGSKASVIGSYFNPIGYGVNRDGIIDYDQVRLLARKFRPKLIICGASAYPRTIDFQRFRQIADEVDAFLLADISHIAGLVVTGEHPSPIDHAHFTTTSTYKQLYGPRGGLILIGKEHEAPGPSGHKTLAAMIQKAVFPFFQGTPNLSAIAAKARALQCVTGPDFRQLTKRIVDNAKALARCFAENGYKVLTDGTDNHMVLIDVLASGITGTVAEQAFEECRIIINKNKIPGDTKSAQVTSGIRLGTNTLAYRGMRPEQMEECAALGHAILSSVKASSDSQYELATGVKGSVRAAVEDLCARFPIPRYPMDSAS